MIFGEVSSSFVEHGTFYVDQIFAIPDKNDPCYVKLVFKFSESVKVESTDVNVGSKIFHRLNQKTLSNSTILPISHQDYPILTSTDIPP